MSDKNDNLQREAAYQDLKVEKNPRAQLKTFYDDVSAKYTRQYKNELVGNLNGKKVLEIGCGKGEETLVALRAGASVTAIDISPKSVELLINNAQSENLSDRLSAMVMDAHHLEFADEAFDIVIGNGILHHLPDLEQAIKEIYRVLKTSGYAVFLEPLGMNPFINLFRKATPEFRTPDEQPFRMQELNMIKKFIPNVQFVFFDCSTLISKFLSAVGLKKISRSIQGKLISLDEKLIRRKVTQKISFLQKMSWMILIKIEK